VHLRAVGTGLKGICRAKNFGVEEKNYHPKKKKKKNNNFTIRSPLFGLVNYDSPRLLFFVKIYSRGSPYNDLKKYIYISTKIYVREDLNLCG
jgi:hypothetical protein